MATATNRKRTVDHQMFIAFHGRVLKRLLQFISEDEINRMGPHEIRHISACYWGDLSEDDAVFLILSDLGQPPIGGVMP